MRFLSTEKIANNSARHPWITIGIWVLAIIGSIFIAIELLGSAITMEDKPLNNPDYYKAQLLLEEKMPGFDQSRETIVIDSDLLIDDPKYAAFVGTVVEDLNGLDDIHEGAVSYFQTQAPQMVSEDQKTTIIPLALIGDTDEAMENVEKIEESLNKLDIENKDFDIYMIGEASMFGTFQEIAETDARTGEAYGILAAMIILALVFGTLVAAAVPIILAIVAIIVAVAATALIGQRFEFAFFVVNMITMMGLAVGIDYSLFIVSRFREERLKGRDKIDAITATGATANRAVFFSGITVLFSLLGMLVIPHSIFRSLGTGAMLVVGFAIIASLTLLPAVLSILGDKINSLKIPYIGKKMTQSTEHGFWGRIAKSVMKHPVISMVATLSLLLLLASSYLSINLGSSMGPDSLPDDLPQAKAIKLLEDKFAASGSQMTSVFITVDGQVKSLEIQDAIGRLQADLQKDKDLSAGQVMNNEEGDLALITAPIITKSKTRESKALDRLQDKYIPEAFGNTDAEVLITGQAVGMKDFTKVTNDYMPIVFGIVLSLSFILLTIVFRSIVVPIKAIIMNLLSVGAAYGLIVLVFQKGYGADFLGFETVEVIETWLPLFLFSILFGLSMDYHVFLLSRIREHFDQTHNNTESVAFGLASTGSIITGAAIIMVAVFGGFAAGDLVMFQQMGFGLAAAVFLDATIVRTILVPASMRLLGDRNWYLPKFLQWLPDIKVEGSLDGDTVAEAATDDRVVEPLKK